MTQRVDEMLLAALREPARLRMSMWHQALREHHMHQTFALRESAIARSVGFVCSCSGEERDWNISIASLQSQLPQARKFFEHLKGRGAKARKRETRRAEKKARALFHKYLTKSQRWQFRANNTILVKGQDNRTYLITAKYGGNVLLVENNTPIYRLCIVPSKDKIPLCDLLLAQKVILESATETFLKLAEVVDLRTDAHYKSGSFLWDNTEGIPIQQPVPGSVPVSDWAIDNPEQWAASCFAEVRNEQEG